MVDPVHGGVIFVAALALVALGDPAPPATASEFSIGIGYAVSQQARGNSRAQNLLHHVTPCHAPLQRCGLTQANFLHQRKG